MSADDGVRRLGETLDRAVAGLASPSKRAARGGDAPVGGVAALFGGWDLLVGPAIAAHARPVGVEDGHLILAVDDPGWAAELRWMAGDLVGRIAAGGGPRLEGLKVRVRPR